MILKLRRPLRVGVNLLSSWTDTGDALLSNRLRTNFSIPRADTISRAGPESKTRHTLLTPFSFLLQGSSSSCGAGLKNLALFWLSAGTCLCRASACRWRCISRSKQNAAPQRQDATPPPLGENRPKVWQNGRDIFPHSPQCHILCVPISVWFCCLGAPLFGAALDTFLTPILGSFSDPNFGVTGTACWWLL